MRPLVIATAGHVHHGKSSFIQAAIEASLGSALAGQTTNRLPEEIRKGMTLDLGFVHTPEISFIDCPGHDSLVKHLIAGHRALDGACLVIALNEGLQEQTREHARVMNWLGINKVMVVFSKFDLVPAAKIDSLCSQIFDEIKKHFDLKTHFSSMLFSKNTPTTDIVSTLSQFFQNTEPTLNLNTAASSESSSSRLFIDRAFTLNGIGTIITGTWNNGVIQKHDEGYLFIPGKRLLKKVRVKTIKNNQSVLEKYQSMGRLALNIDGASSTEIKRGSILVLSKSEPLMHSKYFVSLNGEKFSNKRITAIAQIGTLSLEAKLIHSSEQWQMLLPFPCPLQKNDPLIVRLPHRIPQYGHCVAGGKIIDIYKKKTSKSSETIQIPIKQKTTTINTSPVNEKLANEIDEKKWSAQVSKENWSAAQLLCKQKKAYFIKDDLFLSPQNHLELHQWLKNHFAKNSQLTIDDARDFFKVGRKTFIKFLEYSDRNHWTFRKGEARVSFKLEP